MPTYGKEGDTTVLNVVLKVTVYSVECMLGGASKHPLRACVSVMVI